MTEKEYCLFTDWASPPGDTILDLLEEREWTQVDLAKRMGYSTKHVSQLVNGKVSITQETACRLERVLGSNASFWLNREAQYRDNLARLEEMKKFEQWVCWVDEHPVPELMKAGAIEKRRRTQKNKPNILHDLLRFYGVATPDEWNHHYKGMAVVYRRAREDESNIGAISAWLRLGEIKVEQMTGPKYNKSRFEKALKIIRSLTVLPPEKFEQKLLSLCHQSGVALVFVPSIPRAHVSGAARWLKPYRPIIQLSLYGKTNDRFWFTFFHEAAHILMHNKEDVFLDELDARSDSKEEFEANKWAANMLIPEEYVCELPNLKSKDAVRAFASKVDIHPGIIVGRLQHDGIIRQSWMNEFKVSFKLSGCLE